MANAIPRTTSIDRSYTSKIHRSTQQWPTVFELASLYTRPETWAAARETVVTHLHAFQGGGDVETISTRVMWLDEFFRLNVPDFWFIHWLLLGVPPLPIVLLTLCLLVVTLVSGVAA